MRTGAKRALLLARAAAGVLLKLLYGTAGCFGTGMYYDRNNYTGLQMMPFLLGLVRHHWLHELQPLAMQGTGCFRW